MAPRDLLQFDDSNFDKEQDGNSSSIYIENLQDDIFLDAWNFVSPTEGNKTNKTTVRTSTSEQTSSSKLPKPED